jgi:hypothetical protein
MSFGVVRDIKGRSYVNFIHHHFVPDVGNRASRSDLGKISHRSDEVIGIS